MPIYVLGERTRSVAIPHQAVALAITGSVADAALHIRAAADQPVARSSAHQVVLPIVTGPLTVSVEPVGNAAFGHNTVIHLSIGPDTPGGVDPVQVVFDPIDVSGDSGVELATLTPSGTRIEVAVSAVADRQLSRLASAARVAARSVVGRRSEPSAGAVVIAVDTSASMQSAFDDGSVPAAVDIVVGIADAVGVTDVSAVLVGERRIPVLCGGAAGLADAVRSAEPRWCAGARWAVVTADGAPRTQASIGAPRTQASIGAPRTQASIGAPRTVACTDFPTLTVRQHFPVLAIATDPRLGVDCALLRPPRPGADAAEELLAAPAALEQIAVSLVRRLM
jgi:hypothetical protein